MPRLVLSIVIRVLLCVFATWVMWHWLDLVAVVVAAPLLGVALARPIIDLVAESHHAGKTLVLQDLQGRHFSHRGYMLDIAEDDDDQRWLLLADVRQVVAGLPRDEVLQRQFGDRTTVMPPATGLRIRADALADYLLKSTDAASLKFKVWLDREVRGGSRNPRMR
jgi:hypothetical protein